MKRKSIAVLAFVLVIAFTACSKINAQSGGKSSSGGKASPVSDFSYDLTKDGTGIIITDYTGQGGNVVIPSTIENYPVKRIGNYAFQGEEDEYAVNNCDKITSIVVPDSVEEIGFKAFAYINELTQVTLPNGLKIIQHTMFKDCKKLKKANLPSNLELINYKAFEYCGELSELIIPDSLTKVEFIGFFGNSPDSFYGCRKLPIATRQKIKNLGYTGSF